MTEENKNILSEALSTMCQNGVCLVKYQKVSTVCPLTALSALTCRNLGLYQCVTKVRWEDLIEEPENAD